jgi:hypothetical protein
MLLVFHLVDQEVVVMEKEVGVPQVQQVEMQQQLTEQLTPVEVVVQPHHK